jgi:hypothetical protein
VNSSLITVMVLLAVQLALQWEGEAVSSIRKTIQENVGKVASRKECHGDELPVEPTLRAWNALSHPACYRAVSVFGWPHPCDDWCYRSQHCHHHAHGHVPVRALAQHHQQHRALLCLTSVHADSKQYQKQPDALIITG